MKRHFLKLSMLWIVPLLIARALIPTGFMVSVGADGLELMFCPGAVTAADRSQRASLADFHSASLHAGHGDRLAHQGAQHSSDRDAAGASHENAPCPFSLVVSGVSFDVPFLAAASFAPTDDFVEFISAPASSAGPLRTDRIRGPPARS